MNGHALEASLLGRVEAAIEKYSLLLGGERVLLGLSGGKDSLSMLRLLALLRDGGALKFEIFALFVRSDFRCAGCAHVETLRAVSEGMGVPFDHRDVRLLGKDGKGRIDCFTCSWGRRKALFSAAREKGCSKIALGHHQDDIAQTILMNVFIHGEHSGMAPRVRLFGGEIEMVRPLAFVREAETAQYARSSGFPTTLCRCPFGRAGHRAKARAFLEKAEGLFPGATRRVFESLYREGVPLWCLLPGRFSPHEGHP